MSIMVGGLVNNKDGRENVYQFTAPLQLYICDDPVQILVT
jgi:hypothetical protein